MLLMPNKKKIASIIVLNNAKPDYVQQMGERGSSGKMDLRKLAEASGEKDMDDDLMSQGLESAATDLMGAIKMGNTERFISGMKSFLEICGYKKEGNHDEGDEY